LISEEKIKEIRRKITKGHPAGELKQELKNEGYSDEDINACFKAHKYDMRSWYLFFGIVITITGLCYADLHAILWRRPLCRLYL
jgi:hypothetical protein